MKILKTISGAREHIGSLTQGLEGPGFVPTMGALHEGHLSLVRRSVEENRLAGVSIFVNPIQFNNPRDLEQYPRTLDEDLGKLASVLRPDDFVFIPAVEEMYPTPVNRVYDFGNLGQVMEGRFRPGHFNGVGIVVDRLFRIVRPGRAYFGEKDFQQMTVIRKLMEIEKLPVEIIPCAIIREPDGLAMSSRNVRLTAGHRKAAPVIYQALREARQEYAHKPPGLLKEQIRNRIDSTGLLVTEYVEIAFESTLQPVHSREQPGMVRCFTAVQAGDVRLIDNLRFTPDN